MCYGWDWDGPDKPVALPHGEWDPVVGALRKGRSYLLPKEIPRERSNETLAMHKTTTRSKKPQHMKPLHGSTNHLPFETRKLISHQN